MDEVSESSNTSAPEPSMMGGRDAPAGQLRLLSQQGASNGRDPFDDRILTASSAEGERPLLPGKDGGGGALVLDTAESGATELRMVGNGTSSFGATDDRGSTISDSSASHLGDTPQSDPVAAPALGDAQGSRQAPASISLSDHTMAANDALDPSAPGPWRDAGSGVHRNSVSSHDADFNHDSGPAASFNPSLHPDHLISSTLDILPLDDVSDPAQHHNSAAADHHNVPANDDAPQLEVSKPADTLKIDSGSEPADHVNANHNEATSSGAGGPAADGATIHQAQPTAPSTGELVETGARAILLATDDSSSRLGPHASAADFMSGPTPVHSTTAAFSPGVLGARDQLASAIATATPEVAAITTLPPPQGIGANMPTLGGDMHALQKHAA